MGSSARFEIKYLTDGTVSLKNVMNGKFVVVEGGRLFAKDAVMTGEKFVMTAHEDGTISLKCTNGKYVGSDKDGKLMASHERVAIESKFRKVEMHAANTPLGS